MKKAFLKRESNRQQETPASDTEYIGCRFDFKVGESCDLGQRWKNRKHCE